MALNNIIPPSKQITNASGKPLAGGKVFLFEPGTTTFVNSYQDSGLVTPHSNPVKLSGSGRANIWITRDVDMFIADRNSGDLIPTNIILSELNANPDALGADEAGGLISNGSFEIDADADTIPDGWVLTSEAGSTNAIDTSESTDGAQSFRFTSSGAGGGTLTTEDFFPVNDVDPLRVNVDLRSSVAGVHNIVRVEWYDVSQVPISNSDPYDSTANPLTFTSQNLVALPPAGARFAKLKLIGCDPDTAVAGSTWFDRASVFYPAVVTGVFDNITIQNNEIITTNTNGNLNITPDGTGRVRIKNNTVFVNAADTQVGLVGFDASAVNMEVANDVDGGLLSLIADDTGAVTRNLLVGDPDAGVSSYYQGSERVRTISDGFRLYKSDSLDTGNNVIRFAHADGTERGYLGHVGGPFDIVNEVHGSNIRMLSEDLGGTLRPLFSADPDGQADLYYNGSIKFSIVNTGVNIRGSLSNDPTAGGNQDSLIVLQNNAAEQSGQIGFKDSNAHLFITNNTHGGNVIISSEKIGGTPQNIIVADPDDSIEFVHPGDSTTRIKTANNGIVSIRSTGSTDSEIRKISFEHQNGTVRAFCGHNGTQTLVLRNEINGGIIALAARNTAGTFVSALESSPDSNTKLYYSGTEALRTISPSSGGCQVNNTLTGAGFERVLTESDTSTTDWDFFGIMVGDEVIVSDISINYPPELTWALPSSGSWPKIFTIEFCLFVSCPTAGTNPGLRVRLDHDGTVAHISSSDGNAMIIPGIDAVPSTLTITGLRLDADVEENAIPLSGNTAGSIDCVIGRLQMRTTNNFPAGNLRLGFGQSLSSATGVTVHEGSYMRGKWTN